MIDDNIQDSKPGKGYQVKVTGVGLNPNMNYGALSDESHSDQKELPIALSKKNHPRYPLNDDDDDINTGTTKE